MKLILFILMIPVLWAAWRMARTGRHQAPAAMLALAVIGGAAYGLIRPSSSPLLQLVHDSDEAAGFSMGALLLEDLGPKPHGVVLLMQQFGLPSASREQRHRQRRGVEAALKGTDLRVEVTGPDWSSLTEEEFDGKAREDFTAEEFETLMKPYQPIVAVIAFCGFPPRSAIPADWPPFYVVQPDRMFNLRPRLQGGVIRALAIPRPNWHPAHVPPSGRSASDLFSARYELARGHGQK